MMNANEFIFYSHPNLHNLFPSLLVCLGSACEMTHREAAI